ncbi:piggyBac transposable element-derived protein 4-like, partial [Pecten maximus]|uniref:piggyBac transposable element-derived protein 4-like n=1 Tax=Pecten maximus TaxID=6579 RepID=UPI001458E474
MIRKTCLNLPLDAQYMSKLRGNDESDLNICSSSDELDDSEDEDVPLATLLEDRIPLARLTRQLRILPELLPGIVEETEQENDEWTANFATPVVNEFTGNPGPAALLFANKNEMDFFNLIFPHQFFSDIAAETNRDVSFDEAMIGYTGRLTFKQYVPMKLTKRGIKVWMRADPNNGYVNEFQVYTGRQGPDPEHGLGERVVWDLTRHIARKNHHVFCDNYFTSVNLFERLLAENTYACGTVRVNRKGLPKEVTTAKLKIQGDMVQRQKGNLVATAWRDKRTVHVLSTNSDPQTTTTVTRKQKSGQLKDVGCPDVIKNYTANMNG